MKFTKVDISEDRRTEAIKWTKEHIGKSKGENNDLPFSQIVWYNSFVQGDGGETVRFYFRHPEHATLFALRWL